MVRSFPVTNVNGKVYREFALMESRPNAAMLLADSMLLLCSDHKPMALLAAGYWPFGLVYLARVYCICVCA